jgi:repressor LexA
MQDERVRVGSGFGRKFSSCSGSAAASEASGAVLVGATGTVAADFRAEQGAQRGSSHSCVVFGRAAAQSVAGGAAGGCGDGRRNHLAVGRRTEALAAALDLDIITAVYSDRQVKMSDLTPRQTQILRLIQRFIAETGMPPTRAEIAHELGFRSANAAEEHLRALARKGVIALVPGTSRGIKLKDTIREQMGLPLIGRVAAGKPIFSEENFESRLQIDPEVFQPRPHYLLKVIGMSMKDAGILDGDLVAVHRTSEVRSRQIVVARLENEVTVKRYRQEGPVVWLLPENSEFEPIRVDLREEPLLIEGIVVGVVRRGRASGLM